MRSSYTVALTLLRFFRRLHDVIKVARQVRWQLSTLHEFSMRVLFSASLQHFELVEMERLAFVDELLALVFELQRGVYALLHCNEVVPLHVLCP